MRLQLFDAGFQRFDPVQIALIRRRGAPGRQLARLTLAELERQLRDAGVDVVRVHRSWLVNRASIAEIAPTGEGDVTITLRDGDTAPGSRRYREPLAA